MAFTTINAFMRKWLLVCLALCPLLASGRDQHRSQFVPKKLPDQQKKSIVDAKTVHLPIIETATVTNHIDPAWLKPNTEPFTLGPGDRLEIELLGDPRSASDPATMSNVIVGPDGKIYYSILPGIDVWGKTVTEVKGLLEQELGKFFRDKQQVGITVRSIESRRVWLLGRFQLPGVYSLSNSVTLLEALSLAGGSQMYMGNLEMSQLSPSEELADLKRAFVVRNGQLLPVDFERLLKQGDLSQNIYLQPEDFVYLPPATAREVTVVGAVSFPRTLPYQDGMTLSAAIAGAGGTYKDSYWNKVAIVRGSWSKAHIAIVNYEDIVKGRAADVPLEPRDIIHVPLKPWRHIERYANLILNTFVSSLAINEGARAVTKDVAPTGILIPLGSKITVTTPTGAPIPTR
jgi:polysaccharide export outer membrane protein